MKRLIRLSGVLCSMFAGTALADEQTYTVSMISLLIEPKPFIGKQVEVSGYLRKDINLRLYFTGEHASAMDIANSLLVSDTDQGDISRSECLFAFVTLKGRFSRRNSDTGFVIEDLSRIYLPASEQVCWTNQQ